MSSREIIAPPEREKDEGAIGFFLTRTGLLRPTVPHLAVLAILTLLLAAFFWQLTIQHRVLSPADWVFTAYPWAAVAPPGFESPANVNQGDDAFLFYPRRWSLYADGATGFSWWQDDYLAGTRNTFSNGFLGLAFYPPAWVYHLLPFHIANGVFHVGILLVAGVSMYLLLWQLRLPRLPALYGALLFMLNGHFIVWLGAAFLPAILGLIPLMIFGFERYRETRQPLYLLIPAVGLALQIYLAYIPGWVVTASVLVIYGVVRLVPTVWTRDYRLLLRGASVYAATAGFGLLLAAYSLLPSVSSALGSDYQRARDFGLIRAPLENAWTYVFPDYWGTPETPATAWLGYAGGYASDYPGLVAYFGISAAPLALVGLWRLRQSWAAWFAFTVLLFSVGEIYGIPPVDSLGHLPGLKQSAAFRWNFGLPLAVSLLAPLGMTVLLDYGTSPRTNRHLAAAIVTGLVIAVVAVALLYMNAHDTASWKLITEGGRVFPPLDEIVDEVRQYSSHFLRQLAFLFASGFVCVLALTRRAWARLAALALVLITFLDLFAFGSEYNATVEKRDLYPETPGLAFLRSDDELSRIVPVGERLDPLPGYTPNLYGLQTITGYDHYRDEEYVAFLGPQRSPSDVIAFDGAGYVNVGSDRWPLNRNLLSVLNVKYIVTSPIGVFSLVVGQSRNDVAYGVYGGLRQGQSFPTGHARVDAVEFLLATGGGPGPDSPLIFRLKRSSGDPGDIYTRVVDGMNVRNNEWFRVDLPSDLDLSSYDQLYVEIEAPQATVERLLFVWGLKGAGPQGWQRFESGNPVPGILAFRALQTPEPWIVPVYEGEDLNVYRVATALPRAWGVGSAEVVSTTAAAMERVASLEFDPASAVIFASENLPEGLSGAQATNGGAFRAEIVDYASDAMTVRTDFPGPGYLVISRRFDEGWQARADGSDAPVLRGDGILQAVPVGPGQHTVELSFRPWEYVWGARISRASGLLVGLGVVLYLARSLWRRSRTAAPEP